MASTACFLHHHAAISSPAAGRTSAQRYQAVSIKPTQIVCKAQKQDDEANVLNASVSRRLALTVLIGAAAVGSKVSPADAAYGEAGILLSNLIFHLIMIFSVYLVSLWVSSFAV